MLRASMAFLLLLSAACAHGPRARSGPGVLFAPAELALGTGLRPWAISVPFTKSQDGTELVLKFLEQAEASGALFVSDVQVVFATEEEGQPLECRTRLVPAGTARDHLKGLRTAKADARPALTLVQRPMSSMQLSCVDEQLARVQTRSYPGDFPSLTTRAQARMQHHPLNQVTQCAHRPVTRLLTRYAFEDAVNYVPPALARIQEVRPELRLEETDAECLPRAPSEPTVNRIEALAYGGSGPRAALDAVPEILPVRLDL